MTVTSDDKDGLVQRQSNRSDRQAQNGLSIPSIYLL